MRVFEKLAEYRYEQLAQVVAHVPETLYRHRATLQRGRPEDLLGAGAHPVHDAEGRERRGVARAAVGDVHADDVGGLDADVLHVLGGGPDVLCGYVAAAQGLDVAPERAEQLLGLVALRVADDDGLASPEIQAARGGLVGHPTRQP